MSSEFIYASTKVLPYVYKLTHKETGQFYFGYREANKVPSTQDLGFKYFTSSKRIINEFGFQNFEIEILAEFFKGEDAHTFEQELIKQSWKHPLLLNGNWQGIKFSTRGISIKWSEERKAKHSLAMCGRKRSPLSEESKRKISMRKRGHRSWLGLTHSEETKLKLSKIAKNRPEETISKMKNSLKRFYEENNVSQETRDKISKANTGKKRSAESRKKYSECQRGLQKTEEHRKNIKESRLSTYVLEDINGNQTVIRENFRTWCKANDLSERILLRSLETKEFFKGFTLKSTTKKIK